MCESTYPCLFPQLKLKRSWLINGKQGLTYFVQSLSAGINAPTNALPAGWRWLSQLLCWAAAWPLAIKDYSSMKFLLSSLMLSRMKKGTGLDPLVPEKGTTIDLQYQVMRYTSTRLLRTNTEINELNLHALHILQYPVMDQFFLT